MKHLCALQVSCVCLSHDLWAHTQPRGNIVHNMKVIFINFSNQQLG